MPKLQDVSFLGTDKVGKSTAKTSCKGNATEKK